MERLEELVRKLEGGELSLDESLRLYEEGVALVRSCTAELDRTEAKIKQLQSAADGSVRAFDFIAEKTEA